MVITEIGANQANTEFLKWASVFSAIFLKSFSVSFSRASDGTVSPR